MGIYASSILLEYVIGWMMAKGEKNVAVGRLAGLYVILGEYDHISSNSSITVFKRNQLFIEDLVIFLFV